MLTVQSVGLSIGRHTILSPISLTVPPGKIVEVRGANGCGKSTLLRILAGLLRPTMGVVSDSLRPVFYMGHQLGLKASLTPLENLTNDPRLRVNETVQTCLKGWGLSSGAMMRPVSLLSRGQQQRVALAKLSFTEASLWLLDEPLTALDTESIAQCERVLQQHTARGGMAVVATHRPLDAALPLECLTL